jgi:uncharacterized integral membrane protein
MALDSLVTNASGRLDSRRGEQGVSMPERPRDDEGTGYARPAPAGGGSPAPPYERYRPSEPPYRPSEPVEPEPEPRRRGGVGYTTYAITVAVLLLAIAVVVFVVQNDERVHIWFFGSTKYMSVAGALAVAAAGGLVVGLLAGFIPQIKLRRELRALRRAARD